MALRVPSGSGTLSRIGLAAVAAAGGRAVASSKQDDSWTALAAGGCSASETDEDEDDILQEMNAATDRMARALQVAQSFTARPPAVEADSNTAGQLSHASSTSSNGGSTSFKAGSTSAMHKPPALRVSREGAPSPGRAPASPVSASRQCVSVSKPRSSDGEQLCVEDLRHASGSSQQSSVFWTPSSSFQSSRSNTNTSFQAIPPSMPLPCRAPMYSNQSLPSHMSDGGAGSANQQRLPSSSARMSLERPLHTNSWSEGGAKQIRSMSSGSRVRFSNEGLPSHAQP